MSDMLNQYEQVTPEQQLADEVLESDQSRVQKALEWDRARMRVTGAATRLRIVLDGPLGERPSYIDLYNSAKELVQRMEELERLERGGV